MKKTTRKLLCILTATILLFASFSAVNALEASQPAGVATAKAAVLSVTLDSTSTWTLTADSYIESFSGSMDDVVTNGHTLYVNGKAMN